MLCENVDCNCEKGAGLVQDGRRFCAEYCLLEGSEGGRCRCGHLECEGEAQVGSFLETSSGSTSDQTSSMASGR